MVREWDNFLLPEDCQRLIELSQNKLEMAEVLGDNSNWRTATSCWLEESCDDLIKELRIRISELVGIPTENFESLHIVKYDVGGEYKIHQDYFHQSESYYQDEISRGGQRSKTALVYLNTEFEGGLTRFPNIYVTVQPSIGKLVIWDNLLSDGTPDITSSHCGLPVTSGQKWIAVIWIRQNRFI